MEQASYVLKPEPSSARDDTAYYRNVELGVRAGRFTVVDASGRPHELPAEALAWVSAGTGKPRLLVLDRAGVVLAELPSEGWETADLADFGDAVGVPFVEEVFPDALTARAAYPLPKGALRIYVKEAHVVVLQFLPVLVPVLAIMILVVILR